MPYLKRISISNFRQFKDVEILFKNQKGLCLFIGKNGIGKSNFLNAVCWCLYEQQPFKFHEQEKKLLNEDAAKVNEFSKVKVSITVSMNGSTFQFQRTKIETQNSKLSVLKQQGEDWVELPNPETVVNNFLPMGISQFFIFDGEAVQNIFKGNYSKKLKESIWTVSGVELLDRGIEHLNTMALEFRRQVTKDEPRLEELEKKLTQIEKEISTRTAELDIKQKQLPAIKTQLSELRAKEAKFTKYREIIKRRELLELQRSEITAQKEETVRQLTEKTIQYTSVLYLKKPLSDVMKKFDEDRSKGELPPKIRETYIKELLEREKCICGTVLKKGSAHYKELLKLIESYAAPMEKRDYLNEDSYEIRSLLYSLESFYNDFARLRKLRSDLDKRNDDNELALKEISKQLLEAPEQEVGSLQVTIEKLSTDLEKLHEDIGGLSSEIKQLDLERQESQKTLEKNSGTINKKINQQKKLEITQEAEKRLSYIRDRIIHQVRESVSFRTNEYFKELIWEKDKFEKVKFTENYDVLVYKRNSNDSSLTELSTGERKVLGFAIIKALGEISGFKDAPVFIDGPLEYLDQEVAGNFVNQLPKFMPNRQVLVFSVDKPTMIEYGKLNLDKKDFYKIERLKDTTSTKVDYYHER